MAPDRAAREHLPAPFLVVVVFWLSVLFLSFGLFSPPNPTVIVTLLVCALSVAGAMFLIVDLDDPFGGLIQISSHSLRNALTQIGQYAPAGSVFSRLSRTISIDFRYEQPTESLLECLVDPSNGKP